MTTLVSAENSFCHALFDIIGDVSETVSPTCARCGVLISAAPGRGGRPRKYCDTLDCKRARHAEAERERRNRKPPPVTTVTFGVNADLIADVARLYLTAGAVVADVTYGHGRFWKKTDTSEYLFLASDLEPVRPGVVAADFASLPYGNGSIDAVVFDPPYIHSPGAGMYAKRYNGRATTTANSHAGIMAVYQAGITEATRVLRPDGGQLWVKCKDTIASERQCWSHIDILEMAKELGMYARDLFLLVPASPSTVVAGGRWPRQMHARKVHSYLWVFETGGYRRRS